VQPAASIGSRCHDVVGVASRQVLWLPPSSSWKLVDLSAVHLWVVVVCLPGQSPRPRRIRFTVITGGRAVAEAELVNEAEPSDGALSSADR
jgi:hypothetical protein